MNKHNEDFNFQLPNVHIGNSGHTLPFQVFDISNSPNFLFNDANCQETQAHLLEKLSCVPPFMDLNCLLEPIYITSKDLSDDVSLSHANTQPTTSTRINTQADNSTHSNQILTQPIKSTYTQSDSTHSDILTQPISSTHSNTQPTTSKVFHTPTKQHISSTHSNTFVRRPINSTYSSTQPASSTHISSSSSHDITSTHSNILTGSTQLKDSSTFSTANYSSSLQTRKRQRSVDVDETPVLAFDEVTICEESEPETDDLDVIIID